MLQQAGVTAVSQTAGPETVLAGEAEVPYALLGYATDYANGVHAEPTPVEELVRLVGASTETFAGVLAAALPRVAAGRFSPRRNGSRPARGPPRRGAAAPRPAPARTCRCSLR